MCAVALDAALPNAIYAARADGGHGVGYFRLDSPATPERIRMACADQFTERAPGPTAALASLSAAHAAAMPR